MQVTKTHSSTGITAEWLSDVLHNENIVIFIDMNGSRLIISEQERQEINLLKEEFEQRGGMTTEELIERLGAVPFEEFINNLRKKVRTI